MSDRIADEDGLRLAWEAHRSGSLPSLSLDGSGGAEGRSFTSSPDPGWAGFEFLSGSKHAAVLSAALPAEPIALTEILFQGGASDMAGWSGLLRLLALCDAEIAVASYGFQGFPKVSLIANVPKKTSERLQRVLPSDSREWRGLHFCGALRLRPDILKSEFGDGADFLQRILPDGVGCKGSVRSDGKRFFVMLSCAAPKESLSLRPGADWTFSLDEIGVSALLSEESSSFSQLLIKGSLTLAGHCGKMEAFVDLDNGRVRITARPNWKVDLGWLRTIAGSEEYAQGAAGFLDSNFHGKSAHAGAEFAVTELVCSLGWKPRIAAQGLSITLGNPKVGDEPAKWELLGGELEASLNGYWSRSINGESSFDCSLEGTWQWEAVKFAASLDTRSGDFSAELDFSDQKNALKAFARKKLFPKAEPPKDEKKPGGAQAGTTGAAPPGFDDSRIELTTEEKAGKDEKQQTAALEKKRSDARERAEARVLFAKPFEVVYFDIAGNYRDKFIEVQLETSGYWGFRLRGTDEDKHRVDVRFGDLLCAGSYDQSCKDAAWSLQVAGTFGLLQGDEPCALGKGARIEGRFGSEGTELSLKIAKFDVGELVGLAMAEEPPKAFRGVVLEDMEIVYRASEEFSFKCKSDIKLFSSVSLKGMELVLASDGKKADDKKKASSYGAAKIGFGTKLVVDLKVEVAKEQIEFSGSAKKVDVSELIEGFFQKNSADENQDKKDGHVIAKEISILLALNRGSKKDEPAKPDPAQDKNEPIEDSSLTVKIELERGDSSLFLLFVAAGMAPRSEPGKFEWKVLFAGDLDLRAKGLPLLGDILGDRADHFGVELHALYLKTAAEGERADDKVVEKLFKKCDKIHGSWKTKDEPKKPLELKEGFDVKAGIRTLELDKPGGKGALSGNGGTSPAAPKPAPPAKAPEPGKDLTWNDVDLRIGPVQLSRVGYGTAKNAAGKDEGQKGVVALDAALDLGVLRLAVIGLGMEVEVPSFRVTPRLEGLAINVRNGPVEITGSLVYRNGVFSGLAQVKTANMTLGAIGRFSMRDSRPSFFLYCVYASSLGGPAEFFIEGLAGGMGYDTRLVLPSVEQVPQFALVKAAKEGLGGSPEQQLATFDACIVPMPNNLWIAAGVRFSTYKMLNSTVVVALLIGDDVEVDLFGLMELRTPMPVAGKKLPVIASVDLAIRGKISPRKGEIWLRAQVLPGSFIFDEKCRLTGGFAFQVWFKGEHKGDFAATLGGYHPAFKRPAHYFDVPRLGIEWQLTPEISIKGGVYMAITSRAIMAGGRLEMLYQSGSVKVSFVAEAHFLAAWAPLQYMADVRIAVDATFSIKVWRWTKDFHVHLAAQLHLEGPPFSGFAKLELGPITVTINFGTPAQPAPLNWWEFAGGFLPPPESVISLRATGLAAPEEKPQVKELDGIKTLRTQWILVPGKEWSFTVETAIPVKEIIRDGHGMLTGARELHAVPMQAKMSVSKMEIKFAGAGWSAISASLGVEMELIHAPVAPALWSKDLPKPPGPGEKDTRLEPPSMSDTPRDAVGVLFRSRAETVEPSTMEVKSPDLNSSAQLPVRRRGAMKWEALGDDIFADGTVHYQRPRARIPQGVAS